ncbi:selenocysteine insertion sequence-binding protein 2 [Eurosta solidaginis]|uniref:selenocysteine insertion sequence-binding protein 2 n=1 Tax=Eurosta solidaginis TaxID=178769 RepID=UPI003530BB0D
MSSSTKGTSDKLNIIDRKTFESIQHNQNNTASESFRKVHNPKFRKKNAVNGESGGAVFNLMQFLTKTPKQKQKERKRQRYTVCILGHHAAKPFKKCGKTREGGKRKKLSHLKKSIVRCRELKKQQPSRIVEENEELLKETVDDISNLSLDLKKETKEHAAQKEEEKTENDRQVSQIVHSRRFRSYCDNCTTPLLSQLTEQLLRELDRFQKRALEQNPIKAHAHRRFVVGFREAKSMVLVKKVKMCIIAPDCEVCEGKDGLDAKISYIKSQCQQQSVPYLFSLRRRQLAYALFKKAPVGCVAILDFDGAREIYSKLIESLQEARKTYEELTKKG